MIRDRDTVFQSNAGPFLRRCWLLGSQQAPRPRSVQPDTRRRVFLAPCEPFVAADLDIWITGWEMGDERWVTRCPVDIKSRKQCVMAYSQRRRGKARAHISDKSTNWHCSLCHCSVVQQRWPCSGKGNEEGMERCWHGRILKRHSLLVRRSLWITQLTRRLHKRSQSSLDLRLMDEICR